MTPSPVSNWLHALLLALVHTDDGDTWLLANKMTPKVGVRNQGGWCGRWYRVCLSADVGKCVCVRAWYVCAHCAGSSCAANSVLGGALGCTWWEHPTPGAAPSPWFHTERGVLQRARALGRRPSVYVASCVDALSA